MSKIRLQIVLCILSIFIRLRSNSATTNCTQPPKAIAPEKCCDFPRLFQQAALDHCQASESKGNQCFYECVYAATELCRKRKCDVRKSDDYIDWVKLKNTDFNDVYKQAYRECITEVTQLNNGHFQDEECDPQPELIEICVHNKMFTICPDKYYRSDISDCAQEREYLKNCVKTN